MAPLLDLTKEHTAKVLALGYRLATVEHSTSPNLLAVYYPKQLKGASRLHYALRRRIELLFIVKKREKTVISRLVFGLNLRTIEAGRVTRHFGELVGSGRLCRCSGSERTSFEI